MKLQYNIEDYYSFRVLFKTYQDGKLINIYPVYEDEAEAEVNKLEEQGYTYGYTEKQVQRAKESYEYKLERIIKSDDDHKEV